MKKSIIVLISAILLWAHFAQSQTLQGLPENASSKVKKWAVRFDFDDDSCYPAPAISKDGRTDGGLKATGSRTGDCRDRDQFLNANTFCRTKSVTKDSITYEVIMYSLYFEKDQYALLDANRAKGLSSG